MTALAITTSGTASGIDEFCNGEIDMATATRKMTAAERAICDANDVAHSELLIGHHIVSLITHVDAAVECLSASQLHEVLKPSASNTVTDWSFAGEELAELPLTPLLPRDDQLEFFIADSVVPGDGLRLDAATVDDAADMVARVGETEGALGLLAGHEPDAASTTTLQVSGNAASACNSPSAEAVENGDYDFALSLYIVVNRARLGANNSLAEFLQFISGEDGAAAMRDAGVAPPTPATADLNALILSDPDAAASAVGGSGDYEIPLDLSGEVKLAGAANAYQILSRVGDRMTEAYERFSYDFAATTARSAIASLCAGEADIALLDAAPADDAIEACAANDTAAMSIDLGAQATVLLGNAGDGFSACLTAEQVNAVWTGGAESWAEIDAAFPDQPMTLFGPSFTDQYTDILLQTAADVIPPVRRDTEKDFDPLYRAAAVGNVPGGLTYMSWPDYQKALANEQANIHLVSVDAGPGCVEPDDATIENGAYPLSRQAGMLISQPALAEAQVQAYLWSLAEDDNWTLLEREGFVGASTLDLPLVRRNLATWFAAAEARYPQEDGEAASGEVEESADEQASEDASE